MPPRSLLNRLAIATLPAKFTDSAAAFARSGPLSPEVARALPDSKGGEEPKDLQRWRTDLFELFTTTIGESQLFFSADQWVRVQLLLETAGPVAVSTRSEITPVLSGKGRLLTTDVPYEVYLPKGSRLYYAASSINRIAVTFEPIPWMEQLSNEIRRVAGAVSTSAQMIAAAIAGRIAGGAPPAAPAPGLKRLTKIPMPGKIR